MVKIICTRGYSGSGKSTWARHWQQEDPKNRVITSRDDLRETLFQDEGILSQDKEAIITRVQRDIVKNAVEKDFDVVIHDTHLRVRFLKDWADFAADLDAEFEIRDFKIDADECVQRDKDRRLDGKRFVGETVIRNQARKWPVSQWKPVVARPKQTITLEPYIGEPGLPYVIIVDIDGTIADMGDARGPFEWAKVGGDLPHEEIINIVEILSERYNVVFFSGREDVCYDETLHWLIDNVDIALPELHMRKAGDGRRDSEVKLELFNKHIRGRFNVAAVIDDRLQVCRMWNQLGVPLFRVGDPDASF